MVQYDREDIVCVSYASLMQEAGLSAQIESAFGAGGIGILAISGVPQLGEMRERLLPLARKLAELPSNVLLRYEHAASSYCCGWSHGKEHLQGKPDVCKGSFYANPTFDRPVDDAELIAKLPASLTPNIW
jgi:non-haem dioxygenase in morphine synthesis N-terminal